MEADKLNEDVVIRLNVLINLLLDQTPAESSLTTTSKIYKLEELGIPPSDIAKILGKPLNHVTSASAKKRTKGNK
jgi:hypothetical protein